MHSPLQRYENKKCGTPYFSNSINLQMNLEYNINANIKEPELNFTSVECKPFPKALIKGTDIYGIYHKLIYSWKNPSSTNIVSFHNFFIRKSQ